MDRNIIALFDDFTHGGMDRRSFLARLATLAGSAAAASAALSLLENDYARAETVPEGDPGLGVETVAIGGSPVLRGYLARPKDRRRRAAVVVIHENRGLNPHIRDIARRLAKAGYVALAPDFLSSLGGTPDDPDRAREMFGKLTPGAAGACGRAAVADLKHRKGTTGKVGAVGFCWGGGQVGTLAVAEPGLDAGVVYYGAQPPAEKVAAIHAPLLLHYAGLDTRIGAGVPAFEAALKAAHKTYEIYRYEGADHAFNNDTNAARYNKAAADLAWSRTLAFFARHLR